LRKRDNISVNVRIDLRLLRMIVLLAGLLGLLAVIYGIVTSVNASNQYNALPDLQPSFVPPTNPNDMTEAQRIEIRALAALDQEKQNLLIKRGQATTIIGIGAAILGGAVLIFLRLPEDKQDKHA
jgi:hypothetical protein